MKNIAGWVGASAIITVLWGACTVTTDDNGGAGHPGTGGTSTGTGGTSSTGGTSNTGGVSDSGTTDARSDTGAVTACEQCGIAMCGTETNNCNATAACTSAKTAFYSCLASGEDFVTCSINFSVAMDAGGGGTLGNELATCLSDMCDSSCLSTPDGG